MIEMKLLMLQVVTELQLHDGSYLINYDFQFQ